MRIAPDEALVIDEARHEIARDIVNDPHAIVSATLVLPALGSRLRRHWPFWSGRVSGNCLAKDLRLRKGRWLTSR